MWLGKVDSRDTIEKAVLDVLDQQQTVKEINKRFVNSSKYYAQKFTVGIGGYLTKVKLWLGYKAGNPGNITVEIRNVAEDGKPGNTILASKEIEASEITTSITGAEIEVSFNTLPTLVLGTSYFIVLNAPLSAGDDYRTWVTQTSSPNGKFYSSQDAGDSWVNEIDTDMYFKAYIGSLKTLISDGILREDLSILPGKKIGTKTIEEYQDTVDKAHIQNTDTILDEGGENEISVEQIAKKTTANATYYINPDTGNDDTGDGTSENPFATIQYALDLIPKIVWHNITILLQDSLNYSESINMSNFINGGGNIFIRGSSNDSTKVLISGSTAACLKIKNNGCAINITNLSIRITQNNKAGIYVVVSDKVQISDCAFGDNDNSGTRGILVQTGTALVSDCIDYDSKKVSIGIYTLFGGRVILDTESFGDSFVNNVVGVITDTITLNKDDYDDAVSKKHSQNSDVALRTDKLTVDANGHTVIAGELGIKEYAQETEPTLNANSFMAIWKDTNDSNKIYLIFRRAEGDQVKIQLT